jgi:hypothetical protein
MDLLGIDAAQQSRASTAKANPSKAVFRIFFIQLQY